MARITGGTSNSVVAGAGPHLTSPTIDARSPLFIQMPPPRNHGMGQGDQNSYERRTRDKQRSPYVAFQEWLTVARSMRSLGAEIFVAPPPEGSHGLASDIVYMANAGFIFEGAEKLYFVGSRNLHGPRQGEYHYLEAIFNGGLNLNCEQAPGIWEGQADISRPLIGKDGSKSYILTHGVRTTFESNQQIKKHFNGDSQFIHVQLVDPFFHGDTAINVVHNKKGEQFIIYCPEALTPDSVLHLETEAKKRGIQTITIDREDAEENYVANSEEINGTLLLLETTSNPLMQRLEGLGFGIVTLNLDTLFKLGGGGTRCCTLEVRGDSPAIDGFRTQLRNSEFVFDETMLAALAETYPHDARLQVGWKRILPPALRAWRGGDFPTSFDALREAVNPGEVKTSPVISKQGQFFAPDNFYVTNGHEIAVIVDGVRNELVTPRPGGVVVSRGNEYRVVRLEDIAESDQVLTSEAGLVVLGAASGSTGMSFGFMQTGAEETPEASMEARILRVAQTMMGVRQSGKKIVFTGGPALAHSDTAKYLAALTKAGWIDRVTAGNALYTHDMELNSQAGTSLGSSPDLLHQTGERAVPGGEQHHLRLINAVRDVGGVAEFIRRNSIGDRSFTKALVEAGVPLNGISTIRDDGPLPGLVRDFREMDKAFTDVMENAGLVIAIGSYLHSDALLKHTPLATPVVLVDQNKGVTQKLRAPRSGINTESFATTGEHFVKELCLALGVDISDLGTPTPMGPISLQSLDSAKKVEGSEDVNAPVILAPVVKEGVAPEGFMTTTNEPAEINLDGSWTSVEKIKMDGLYVVEPDGRVVVKVFRHLHVGDRVVMKGPGVKKTPLTDANTPKDIPALARALETLKSEGKGISLVAGPSLMSGDAYLNLSHLNRLIESGRLHHIHCGIALPVMSIENKLYGTKGDATNFVRALNEIRKQGGIEGGAFETLDPAGPFTNLLRRGGSLVITSSPNDSGCFPGVITETGAAQDAMRDMYLKSSLMIMAGSVLHSIGMGNLGPGKIPVVVVDKDKFAADKLVDRGTVQGYAMVMDIGVFLSELVSN